MMTTTNTTDSALTIASSIAPTRELAASLVEAGAFVRNLRPIDGSEMRAHLCLPAEVSFTATEIGTIETSIGHYGERVLTMKRAGVVFTWSQIQQLWHACPNG